MTGLCNPVFSANKPSWQEQPTIGLLEHCHMSPQLRFNVFFSVNMCVGLLLLFGVLVAFAVSHHKDSNRHSNNKAVPILMPKVANNTFQ